MFTRRGKWHTVGVCDHSASQQITTQTLSSALAIWRLHCTSIYSFRFEVAGSQVASLRLRSAISYYNDNKITTNRNPFFFFFMILLWRLAYILHISDSISHAQFT